MQTIISKDGVQYIKPNIKYTEDGKLKLDGICWVDGDWLGCYGWEHEDMLWILDTIPASDDHIPEDQYYCHNVLKNEQGWVLKSQVKFTLFD